MIIIGFTKKAWLRINYILAGMNLGLVLFNIMNFYYTRRVSAILCGIITLMGFISSIMSIHRLEKSLKENE